MPLIHLDNRAHEFVRASYLADKLLDVIMADLRTMGYRVIQDHMIARMFSDSSRR